MARTEEQKHHQNDTNELCTPEAGVAPEKRRSSPPRCQPVLRRVTCRKWCQQLFGPDPSLQGLLVLRLLCRAVSGLRKHFGYSAVLLCRFPGRLVGLSRFGVSSLAFCLFFYVPMDFLLAWTTFLFKLIEDSWFCTFRWISLVVGTLRDVDHQAEIFLRECRGCHGQKAHRAPE